MRKPEGVPILRVTVAVLLLGLVVGVGAGLLLSDGGERAPVAEATPTATPAGPPFDVPPAPADPFRTGGPLKEPPVIRRGSDGHLRATLVAETGTVTVAGVPVAGMQTYAAQGASGVDERALLGPTLHVEPGDEIDITLDNRLTIPENAVFKAGRTNCPDGGGRSGHAHGEGPEGPGEAGQGQLTNLHFHGLHVSPKATSPYGDTVLVDMRHGKKSVFEIKLPAGHAKGTYWYHAHRHGCTNDQVFRGLAGMLIVGDSRKDLPARFAGIQTRLLALKDIQVEQPKGSEHWRILASHGLPGQATHRTVNGQLLPELRIRPRETQLWRLANPSASTWYKVALADEDRGGALDRFTVVAQDGNTLDRPQRVESVVMAPGARFDVLVRGPERGRRVLKTLRFDQGHFLFEADDLATLTVTGGPPARDLGEPERLDRSPQQFPPVRGPDRRFTFDMDFNGPGNSFEATIDNALFDPDIPDAAPQLGTTERWTLYNKSAEWHPFHIHQDDFRVVSSSSDEIPDFPGVQDIVSLPPGTPAKPSKVVIEMPYTDFTGKFVFHCHILGHEDAGMMSLVDLRDDQRRRPRRLRR